VPSEEDEEDDEDEDEDGDEDVEDKEKLPRTPQAEDVSEPLPTPKTGKGKPKKAPGIKALVADKEAKMNSKKMKPGKTSIRVKGKIIIAMHWHRQRYLFLTLKTQEVLWLQSRSLKRLSSEEAQGQKILHERKN
jgi:hypothetical protein